MSIAIALLGAALMLVVLIDVIRSVLHIDREGPLAQVVQRGIWMALVHTTRHRARMARRTAAAGPAMMAATFLTWIGLFVLGYALTVWPFLEGSFVSDRLAESGSVVDALYYAGVTVTTLGFGDLTPVAGPAQVLTFVASGGGFVLLTAVVTQLIELQTSLNRRDEVSLRIHDECDGTGDGVAMVLACIESLDRSEVRSRFDAWAQDTRAVQDQLHRFPVMALLHRSGRSSYHPEPAFSALISAVVAGHLLVGGDGTAGASSSPGRLHHAVRRLMVDVSTRHLGADGDDDVFDVEVTELDVEEVGRARQRLEAHLGPLPEVSPAGLDALALLAAQRRVFLDRLDGLTRWRAGIDSAAADAGAS